MVSAVKRGIADQKRVRCSEIKTKQQNGGEKKERSVRAHDRTFGKQNVGRKKKNTQEKHITAGKTCQVKSLDEARVKKWGNPGENN